MAADFSIEQGEFGPRLVLRSEWDEEVSAYFDKHPVKELYLNTALGFKGKDLSFLETVPHLEWLWLIHQTIDDISPIHALRSLRNLKVYTYCKTEIDFSQLPNLEECFLEWRAKAKSLFESRGLKMLWINRYSGKDFSKLKKLVNLESLSLANSPIRSLDGIGELRRLESLGLYNLRRLESLAGVESLEELTGLEVNGCRALRSIEEVRRLRNLRKIHFCNDGVVASLKPLAGLTKLEEVLFYESTNIEDGDLSPLTKLKRLKNVSFQDRPHYSHRRGDFAGPSREPNSR